MTDAQILALDPAVYTPGGVSDNEEKCVYIIFFVLSLNKV